MKSSSNGRFCDSTPDSVRLRLKNIMWIDGYGIDTLECRKNYDGTCTIVGTLENLSDFQVRIWMDPILIPCDVLFTFDERLESNDDQA